MRIVTVSPGYNWKFRDFYYSFDKKIINGLIRAGHSVIPFSDRDVADSVVGMRSIGARLANTKLLAIAKTYMPDVIVLLIADLITNATLLKIKRLIVGCKVANIDCDLIHNDSKMQRLLNRKDIVDATFITSGGFPLWNLRKNGLRAAYIPNPTDSSLENADCFSWRDKFFDLVYISAAPRNSERWALVKKVAACAPDVRVGSFGADNQRIFGQDYFNVLRSSRMALNWSHRNDVPLYASDRIAQLFGSGICVCLPKSSGFEEYFNAKEAIFFTNPEDLIDQIRAAKMNDVWVEIGRAGRDRYRELFNETRVANYVLDFIAGNSLDSYEWSCV